MTALTIEFLQQLTETPGGPGDEGRVRDLIARKIRPFVDDLRVDRIGNLIALKRGTGQSQARVVLAAHMDEVVFFIVGIDKNGFLKIAPSGGVNTRTTVGKVVEVGPDRLPGVICLRPIHMAKSRDEYREVPDIKELVVDIGAKDEDAAKAKVKIGQRAVYRTAFRLMGLNETPDKTASLPARGRISGKAFDDRLGCAVLTEVLSGEPYPFDLVGVYTVQEELGLRGALAAGGHLQPDVVLILEGTVCDDLPGRYGEEKRYPTTRLGNGPALTQRDRSYVVPVPLLQHLLRTAETNGIPYQFKHPNIGGTDAAGFTWTSGIPAGIVSVPCRYIHGPVAVADLSDLHNAVALVKASLPGLAEITGIIPFQAS